MISIKRAIVVRKFRQIVIYCSKYDLITISLCNKQVHKFWTSHMQIGHKSFFSRVLDARNSTYTTACHIFPYSILISWPIKCHGLALFLFGASSSMDWTQSKAPKSWHMLGGLCEGRSGFCFVFFIQIL